MKNSKKNDLIRLLYFLNLRKLNQNKSYEKNSQILERKSGN